MTSVGEPRRRVIGLSITTTLPIRNLFVSGTIARLQRDFDLVVYSTPKTAATLRRLGFATGLRIVEVDFGEEPRSWVVLRQLKKKIYVEGRKSRTEEIWERYRPRPLYQRLGGKLVKWLIGIVPARAAYRWLDQVDRRWNRDARLTSGFEMEHLDVFFATHATSYPEEVLLRNAEALGIPKAYLVLSWDHLASKVVLPTSFDVVMVWNRLSKNELLETHPHYSDERVRVVGVPQMEGYDEAPAQSYEAWCGRYGLDPAKRTLLFSTMPQVRHEQQHVIIQDLVGAIRAGTLPVDLQILIKCHPFDNFTGYESLTHGNPVAVRRTDVPPEGGPEDWVPAPNEVEESRDCLFHCAVNVNIFSTVTIEAAWFDRPVVHIAYDPHPPPPGRIPCAAYYQFDHFYGIVARGCSTMAYSREELVTGIKTALVDPGERADGRRKVVEDYVGTSVTGVSFRIAECLRALPLRHRGR